VKRFHPIRSLVTLAAIAAAGLHALRPTDLAIDRVTVGLLFVAALPWLAEVLSSAEFPGGWKVQFRELQAKQELQAREVQTLRFLARSYLTDSELSHLERLASDQPFTFSRGPTTDSFKNELRRLRGLGLIVRRADKSFSSVLREDRSDLRDHIAITQSGREYLTLRAQIEADSEE